MHQEAKRRVHSVFIKQEQELSHVLDLAGEEGYQNTHSLMIEKFELGILLGQGLGLGLGLKSLFLRVWTV